MENFQYGIICNGEIIAWFRNEDDRDKCLLMFKFFHLARDCHDREWESMNTEEEL